MRPLLLVVPGLLLPSVPTAISELQGLDLPILFESDSDGWHSFKVTPHGAGIEFQVSARSAGEPVHVGILAVSQDSTSAAYAWGRAGGGSSVEYARASVAGDEIVLLDAGGTPGESGEVAVSVRVHSSVWRVLLWGSSLAHFEVRGTSGAVIDAQDAGSGGFFLDENDFTSLGDVGVRDRALGVRAHVGAVRVMEIGHSLVAVFGHGEPTVRQPEVLSVETPSGVVLCPCDVWDLLGRGAGTYTFHVEGVGLRNPVGDLHLFGADARLPT